MNSHTLFAVLFAAATAASLAHGAQAGHDAPLRAPAAGTMDQAHMNWRKALMRLRRENGCFKALYPKAVWQKVPCAVEPVEPYAPGNTVGARTDYTAQAKSGLLYSVNGSFIVSGLTSESGVYRGDDTPNAYSIQLNTNPFSSPACAGHPDCRGWQQFIYASMTGNLFIQYWLLKYGPDCPSGWKQSNQSCVKNSAASHVGLLPITTLGKLQLEGLANSSDYAFFWTGDASYYTSVPDSVLGLSNGWTAAEFNVFGTASGKLAVFNSGTQIWVNVALDGASLDAPNCIFTGYTAETNNLTLSYTAPIQNNLLPPMIYFMEANPPGKTAQQCFGESDSQQRAPAGPAKPR